MWYVKATECYYMKRYQIKRTYNYTVTDYVIANNAAEALAQAKAMPDTTSDVVQPHRRTSVEAAPATFTDSRHPLLIPLEGQQVLFVRLDGKAEKLWVTPFGHGCLNPLNSTIHSYLSSTRRWNDIYFVSKFDKLEISRTSGKIPLVKRLP